MTEPGPTTSATPGPRPTAPAAVRPMVPLLPYQQEDVTSPARFRWCCWSRQIGKSFSKSLRRLLRGLARGRTQIFLSAGERQSRELMLKVRQHCQALQLATRACGERVLEGTRCRELSIELPGGVRIIGLPANPRTVRGYSGDVLLDEFAMHREDREIWAAVFPAVLRGDGELDVASTPKGRGNLFAALGRNRLFEHSTVTLPEAVAAGLQIDPEQIRRSMSDDELYRQEFLCEFLDESSAFLTYAEIAAVEDPSIEKYFNLEGLGSCPGPLFVGLDVARCRDLTVFWVLEAAGGRLLTRGVRESRDEPFRRQSELLRALLGLKCTARACIDAGGLGMPLAEAALEEFGPDRVEMVTFTPAVKDRLAHRLRVHIQEGTIRIPVDESIRNDWHSLRRTITGAGPARYQADRGGDGHADRFWAAALAVRAAETGGRAAGLIESLPGPKLRYARSGIW